MHQYFNSDYFLFGDEPTFLLGGEFNYSRCPAKHWRDRMLKMRAAGLNTVNAYAIWAFHEQSRGVWDFSGDHDLARYIDTAHELGLWVILRFGPFVHGEWRNGGLPQWLLDELGPRARTNDPEYLALARGWYDKVLEITMPRLYSKGGPVIIVQVENELGSAGSKGDDIARGSTDVEENAKHVLYFHGILQEYGVDIPVLDINHFPGKEKMTNLIRGHGMYPINCFGSEGDFSPLSTTNWDKHDRPLLTIETMGGMFSRFYDWPYYSNTTSYQGPIIKPEYIETATYHHLAEGCNGINYYIFVDGQHPDEGNERMIPERDMNFQAPITATGTLREAYRNVKRIGWFLRSFGGNILTGKPSATWMRAISYGQSYPGNNEIGDLFDQYHTEDKEVMPALQHISKVKCQSRVTPGLNLSESNFAFLFNTSTRGTQWKRDIRLTAGRDGHISSEVCAEYPRRVQLTLPPQRNKCLPFFVKLDARTFLEYSTAELLDRRPFGDGTQVILHASEEETVETRLVLPKKAATRISGNAFANWDSPNTLMVVGLPGENYQITTVEDERPLRVIHMERGLAGNVWDIAGPNGPVVAATNMMVLESEYADGVTRAHVQLLDRDVYLHIFSENAPQPACSHLNLAGTYDPAFGVYAARGAARLPAPEITFHKQQVDDCWVWETRLSPDMLAGLAELILHANYDGACARAYWNGRLISDHYFGRFVDWEFALSDHLTDPGTLRMEFEATRSADLKVMPVIDTWIDIRWGQA